MTLRLATRGSALAVAQAEAAGRWLGEPFELVTVTTQGDRRLDVALGAMGGQGVFAKEVEECLLDGRADVAVHSAKDLPTRLVEGCTLAGFLPRADPRDVLVGARLGELPEGAKVGTSSARRAAQLRVLRPDLVIESVRGNIATRVARVGELAAVVVAFAALERLGLEPAPCEVLDPELMLPQVGQGAIALETAADEHWMTSLVAARSDRATERAVRAERAFLSCFGTGCSLPIGALGVLAGDAVVLTGMVARADGRTLMRREASGADPEEVGARLARSLIADGALELLEV